MKTAVFAFGRMNPPTVGHGKLVDKVKSVARSKRGTPLIFLSHTHNNDKDPLPYNKKVKYAQSAFGRNVVKKSRSNTVIKVIQEIEKMGYDECIMVAGSDRVDEFKTLLKKYNGKDWNFKKVDAISAGQRDPDAEGVEGMSATKVRKAARDKDFNTFKMGVAKGVNVTNLYKDLSEESIMENLVEEDWEPTDEELDHYLMFEEEWDDDEEVEVEELDELDEVMTMMQRIKRGRSMRRRAPMMKRMRRVKARRMAPRSRLAYRARKAAIGMLRKRFGGQKGSNYANLPIAQKIAIDRQVQRRKGLIGKIAKRMLPKVRKKEVARLRSARTGGVKKESVEMDINEEFEELFEVNYKVEVPGLPTMFVAGKSPAEVRRKLREIIKPGMISDVNITRVVDAEVKKTFRLKAAGKDEIDDKESRVDEAKFQGIKPTADAQAYHDQMDRAHDHIYPPKRAIKWKVKPPEGTKNVHPDSKWPGMKDGDIEKYNESADGAGDDYDDHDDESWYTHKSIWGKVGVSKDDWKKGWRLNARGDRIKVKVKEDVDEARRGRPPKNPTGDEDQGGEHIIMQLRKSVSLNGRKDVEFGDGSKAQVSKAHAQQALSQHSRMRRSDDKQRFEKHLNMGHGHLKNAVAGKEPPKKINPISGKADHTWMDDPRGHRWRMEEETVNELSVDTISSYMTKASDARKHRKLPTRKVDNRYQGVARADAKLAKAGHLGTTAQKNAKARVAAGAVNKDEKKALNKARQVASEELDLDFEDFLNEQPQSATVSKTMDDQGRRITKRADGSTTTSGAMGSVTRDKTGFKTQEKTPRLGGMSVTRKFDPNEKDLDMDQTSDDPTSATTNYQGKKGNVRFNVTSKGDAERETGRDMLGKDPVTGRSNVRKADISIRSKGTDNTPPGSIRVSAANPKGIGGKDDTAKVDYDMGPNRLSIAGKRGSDVGKVTYQRRNPTTGKPEPKKTQTATVKIKPPQNNPNPRLASVEGYQADYKEYNWRNPATGKNEKKKVNPRLREDAKVVSALIRKAVESKYPRQVIFEVFDRGMNEHKDRQKAFDRVNSFINKGKAFELDRDLIGDDR